MSGPALGLIETKGIDGALQATRAASGAGQVVIVSAERSEGDRITVTIEGDWSAVQAAVEAGARAANAAGELVAMHVIPRSDSGVSSMLPYRRFMARYGAGSAAPVAKTPKGRPRAVSGVRPTERRVASTTKPAVPPRVKTAGTTATGAGSLPMADLEGMAVVKLRRYARSLGNLPIKGREISRANRQQLLEAIASASRQTGRQNPTSEADQQGG